MTNAEIQELIKKDETRTLELKKIHGRVEGRDAHSMCLSEDIIGLLPLPAVPLDLTIIPVTLPSLTLDVHLEARKPPILSPPSSAGFSATNFRHEDSLTTPVLQI